MLLDADTSVGEDEVGRAVTVDITDYETVSATFQLSSWSQHEGGVRRRPNLRLEAFELLIVRQAARLSKAKGKCER